MSGADSASDKKQAYFAKLTKLLEEYPKILIVGKDNVGSNHMQKIRIGLRGKAVLLMGKNTMIRKVLKAHAASNPAIEALLPIMKGNVGFVFTKEDLTTVKNLLIENKVAAVAKAGVIAPCDVTVPAGNTGLEPTQTSFFQALNINTKIAKGQIEIVANVLLIKEGHRVGNSEAALLQKLDIKPFFYGLTLRTVYENGVVYEAKYLDMTDDVIIGKFLAGVRNVASLSLAIGYPTVASLPHSLIRGYKNILSISLATDYTIKQAEQAKKFLANPSAFAAAAAPAASAKDKGKGAPAAVAKVEKVEPEKKEESDQDMGLGLLD